MLILCMIAFSLQAQDSADPLATKIIPPSPEAVAIGKYIDMPVSPYTGIPKIEIPLYTLKSYELSLPITLSYHASGIKMEELSSFVGAGWSIDPGGIVSRTIRGLNDEMPNSGYFSNAPIGNWDVSKFFTADGTVNHEYFASNVRLGSSGNCPGAPLTLTPGYSNILRASRGGLDLEPDMFFFSLPDGQSGKFIHDRRKNRYLIPKQYADIKDVSDANGKPFNSWEIRGLDGTRYIFNKTEITKSQSECSLKPFASADGENMPTPIPEVNAPSSWRTSMIISASGKDTIQFEYEQEVLLYEITTSLTTYDDFLGTFSVPPPNTCASQMATIAQRLKRIYSSAGYEVIFESNTDRQDIQGGKKLDKIVFNYKGKEIKSFKLTSNYAGGSGGFDTKMLMLYEIQETKGTENFPPYVFTYFPELISGFKRSNPNVDHWGYSNGATGNIMKSPAFIYNNIFFDGADREANLEYCRQWSLQKIQYPTGGVTTYDYELHDYANIPPADATFRYTPGLEPLAKIDFGITGDIKKNYSDSKTFQLTKDTDVIYIYTIPELPDGGLPANGLGGTLSGPATSVVFNTTGPTHQPVSTLGAGTYTLDAEFDPDQFDWGNVDISRLKFSIHVYKIKSWQELVKNNALQGGGLRVKQIQSTGDQVFTKSYNYGPPGRIFVRGSTQTFIPGPSSGKLASFPAYTYFQEFNDGYMDWGGRCMGCCVIGHFGKLFVRTATTNYPLTLNQGSYVGYDIVTEYQGSFLVNTGYTVYKYTNEAERFSDLAVLPFVSKGSSSFRNGFLLEQGSYTVDGKAVRQTFNTYSHTDAKDGITGIKVAEVLVTGCQYCENRMFGYNFYTHPTERIQLASSVIRTYDTNNDHYDEVSEQYTYDSYDQLTRKVQHSAIPGSILYTGISYNSVNHKAVEEQKSYYSSKADDKSSYAFKSGMKTVYDPTYIKPSEIQLMEAVPGASASLSPTYVPRLQYDKFDSRGNVTSYHKVDEAINTSVIWGYNQLFPIAEVTHTEMGQVAFTSFENNNEGGWAYASAGITSNARTGSSAYNLSIATIQSNLVLNVGSYIVSYWSTTADAAVNGSVGSIGPVSDVMSPLRIGNWTLYVKRVPVKTAGTVLSISGTSVIDDLRLYPEGALMRTFTYDPTLGMTSQSDANNQTIFYSYDALGRPEYVRDENNVILKRFEYHYYRDNK